MRQETNNEMDLLLRRLGRQDTAAPVDHLDADELNSYAENALPPAARARYTEHLAECARCRDLVVQLSSSAGVVIAQETAKVSEGSWLSKFLASLFSPMVLRYAVPAMGLIVVAAIGIVVLRSEGPVGYSPVGRKEQHEPAQATIPPSQPQPSSSPESDNRGFIDTTKSVSKPAAQDNTGAATGAVAPPPPNAPPIVSITTEVQDAAKKVEQQQGEAEASPAPKATPAVSELKSLEPELRKQPAENAVVVANEPAREKAKTDSSVADVAAASPRRVRSRDEARGLAGAGGATTQGAKREDAAEKDADDADAVIRTVAGRRFRKQGNVWIDTDHSSSRVVTSVARDSEQYRALVADEPPIKQIADALDGEIIVVWKGRAYRIR